MKRALILTISLFAAFFTSGAAAQEPIRVFISVDMEGISGIAHSEMTSASGAEYERGRKLTVADVNRRYRRRT